MFLRPPDNNRIPPLLGFGPSFGPTRDEEYLTVTVIMCLYDVSSEVYVRRSLSVPQLQGLSNSLRSTKVNAYIGNCCRRTRNRKADAFGTGVYIPYHDLTDSAATENCVPAMHPDHRYWPRFIDLLLKAHERLPIIQVVDVEPGEDVGHCNILVVWRHVCASAIYTISSGIAQQLTRYVHQTFDCDALHLAPSLSLENSDKNATV